MSPKQEVEALLVEINHAYENNRLDNSLAQDSATKLIDLLIGIFQEDTSQYQAEIAVAIKILESLLDKVEDNELFSAYLQSFIHFAKGEYNEYLSTVEVLIEKSALVNGAMCYDEAQSAFLDLFYTVSEKDDNFNLDKFLKKFHSILKRRCPDTAFELYVKYLLLTTTNTNVWKKNLSAILEKDENWAAAYMELGVIYSEEQKWREAADNYEKAIALSDLCKGDDTYFSLGWTYSKLRDYAKEETAYRKCLELSPAYPYANNNLGYCLFKQKRYEEAIIYYDKGIELEADKHYPYRNKYEALKKLGRLTEALELIKTYPDYFKTKYFMKEVERFSSSDDDIADIIEKLKSVTESEYAGEMKVAGAMSGIELYPHQKEAIRAMNNAILSTDDYAGLLVLPTGGGKTLTATYWLMNGLLDKGAKIVWLAHRHELLNQAQRSFENVCYSDITRSKPSYNWRIISGQHDKPVHIKPTDDIIIASKTSLRRGMNYFLDNWLKENKDKVFLIIDEAHHAAASEYRELISGIKENTARFKMLGLTATPFRTADNEQGMLKKIFPDDIVYKIDLRELINRGILSEPIFKSVSTSINMSELFQEYDSDDALARIVNDSFFDIESIGRETASAIATNSKRNNAIVNEYVKNKDTYKQTLVFALNVEMAIVLNGLFKANGVRSDFVVSDIRDIATQVTISNEENAVKIQKFKSGELDVLVNVNILTEGTDLPKVQSVFLTRPTKSTILMTQMIGRALRGEKAGGTKDAYIVSFIDDWQDKIAWVNPEQLFIDENVDFTKKDHETQRIAMRLVSISKIEEFAKIANDTVDSRLSEIAFIDRIPVGIYKFSYLIESDDDEEISKSCDVLVYDSMKSAYDELFTWLPNANLTNVKAAAEHADRTLFGALDLLLGYSKQDVVDIIEYYKQTSEIPQMIYLSEREDYDVAELARHIIDNELTQAKKKKYIDDEWTRNDTHWAAFFGIENQKAFRKLINDAIDRIENPEDYRKPEIKPITEKEKIQIQELPLYEIRQRYPEFGEKLRNTVFRKYTDAEGYYYSAQSGFRSKNRLDFQIDHINPMAHGGLTVPDNLQLLKRDENLSKSDKL